MMKIYHLEEKDVNEGKILQRIKKLLRKTWIRLFWLRIAENGGFLRNASGIRGKRG